MKSTNMLSKQGSEILFWAITCVLASTQAGAMEAWAHVEALRDEGRGDKRLHWEYENHHQLAIITMAASLRIGGPKALSNFLHNLRLSLPREMAESLAALRRSESNDRTKRFGN